MTGGLPSAGTRKGPNARLRLSLSPQEKHHLAALYNHDGAWSHDEAVGYLGESRMAVLLAERVIGLQNTDMGRMYQLLARGRVSVFHVAGAALSLVAQLDRAYLRLVLQERGWAFEVTDPALNPHYQGLDQLFPKLNLREVNAGTAHPKALVTGKLSGGGHTPQALEHIASQTKADALYRGIDLFVFTPSPRKGQARAENHKSVMTLIHTLPRLDDTTRFTTIPRTLETYPFGNAPSLLPEQAEILRRRSKPLPEPTLRLLQQPRAERIAQARADLRVDGVLSWSQLRRYYRIEPSELYGLLITASLMRPISTRYGLEVQQSLVVSGPEMTQHDDASLNHRLTLAEMRLSLGIAADPGIWQVDPRSNLKLNQPDAIWISGAGRRVAVEADTGRYKMRVVAQKMDSFEQQGFLMTLWGTPSPERSANLEKQFSSKHRLELINPTWWTE